MDIKQYLNDFVNYKIKFFKNNKFKNVNEAWTALPIEDTKNDIEQNLNDNWLCRFEDPEVYKAFEEKLGHPITIKEAKAMTTFQNKWFMDCEKKITFFNEFAEYFTNVTCIESLSFSDCENLKSITIPDSVEEIRWAAFYKCKKLKKIILPKNLKEIGEQAFACCGLKTQKIFEISCLNFEKMYIAETAFKDTKVLIKFNNNVFKSADDFFEYFYWGDMIDEAWTALPTQDTEDELESNLNDNIIECKFKSKIWKIIFERYFKKSPITLNDTKKIKNFDLNSLFNQDTELSDILEKILHQEVLFSFDEFAEYFPNVEEICERTFEDCPLISIILPEKVKWLKERLFYDSVTLKNIVFPKNLELIDKECFCNCEQIETLDFSNTKLENVEINAFAGCSNLKTVIFPQTLKQIATQAFYNCNSLEKVVIPDNLNNLMLINAHSFDVAYFDKKFHGYKISKIKTTEFIWKGKSYFGYNEFYKAFCNSMRGLDEAWNTISTEDTEDNLENELSDNMPCEFKDKNFQKGLEEVFGKSITIEFAKGFKTFRPKFIPYKYRSLIEDLSDFGRWFPNIKFIEEWCFARCERLEKIKLPEDLKIIENEAFAYSHNLQEINIPNNIITIGENAFKGTNLSKVSNIVFSEFLENIGKGAFSTTKISGCIDLSKTKLNTIPHNAFDTCRNITRIILPKTIKVIQKEAFFKCEKLQEINIPKKTYDIHKTAFDFCFDLKKIIWNGKIYTSRPEKFIEYAFYPLKDKLKLNKIDEAWSTISTEDTEENTEQDFNDELAECKFEDPEVYKAFEKKLGHPITIKEAASLTTFGPHNWEIEKNEGFTDSIKNFKEFGKYFYNVIEILPRTFNYFSKLSSITLPPRLEKIGHSAFSFSFNAELFDLVLPSSVKEIESCAFEYAGNLNVDFSQTQIQEINYCTFSHSGISNLIIPKTVKKINVSAFEGCRKLINVTIPNNVESIDREVFAGCRNLEKIYLPGSLKNFGTFSFRPEVFANTPKLKEIHFKNKIYKSSGVFSRFWSKYYQSEEWKNS